jgi:hypothetical protein
MQIPNPKNYLNDIDEDDILWNETWQQFIAIETDFAFWIVPAELRIFARPKTETQPPHPLAVRFAVDSDGTVHVAANQ